MLPGYLTLTVLAEQIHKVAMQRKFEHTALRDWNNARLAQAGAYAALTASQRRRATELLLEL